jgi:uncharacterized protein (TIGR03083 family)
MEFTGVLTALRSSHDRLAATLGSLTADQAVAQSYDDDWTIAQVASHIGSGAEIFAMFVEAGLKREPAPGDFRPIWEAWNTKPASSQVPDAVAADAALLDRVAALPEEERDRWRLDLFGAEQTMVTLLRMRLSEHALHTWDIVVALDPSATLAPDATEIILGLLPGFAALAGRGATEPFSVHVTTHAPGREYRLEASGEQTRLEPAGGPAETGATLRLPAEAFIRLVYGRLDPAHTPESVAASGVELDTLRRRFPGL